METGFRGTSKMMPGARLLQRGFATQRQPLNRARRGLYGGKRVIFGNNVSHSKRRTRRQWKPNVQHKNLTR